MINPKPLMMKMVLTTMLLLSVLAVHSHGNRSEARCCFTYDEIKRDHLRVYTDIYAALRNPSQVDILNLNRDPFVYNPKLYKRLKEFTNLKCICGSLNREYANELHDGLQKCEQLVSLPFVNWKSPPEFIANFKSLKHIEIYYAGKEQLWDNHYKEFVNLGSVYFFGNSIPDWLNNYNSLRGFRWTVDTHKVVLPSIQEADDLVFQIRARNDIEIEVNSDFRVKELYINTSGNINLLGNTTGPIEGPTRFVISTDEKLIGNLQFATLIGTEALAVTCKESAIPMAELLLTPDLCDLSIPGFLLNEYFEYDDVNFHCPCGKLNCNLWVSADTFPRIFKDFEFNYRVGIDEPEACKNFNNLNQTERLFFLTAHVKSIPYIVSSVEIADSLSLYFETSSYGLVDTRELRKLSALKNLYALEFVFYVRENNEKYRKSVIRQLKFLKKKPPKKSIHYELH